MTKSTLKISNNHNNNPLLDLRLVREKFAIQKTYSSILNFYFSKNSCFYTHYNVNKLILIMKLLDIYIIT